MRTAPTFLLPLIALAVPACGGHPEAAGPDLPAKELRVASVEGALPRDDPFAAAWDRARVVVVALLPQDVAEPRLVAKGVESLRLRALHDGSDVAFRLEWEDAEVDDLVDTDRSSDAVAIQLPAAGEGRGLPDSMMGEKGKPVEIALWRALWQRRVDGGEVGIDALYPNRTVDHYPPDAAKDPEARATLARLYEPPVAVENPVAAKTIAGPVEDLQAEGFGTLRSLGAARSTGCGVHRDGRWHVVISRPLDLAAGARTSLRPGESTYVAVAVWDGGKNQRGALKMRSIWVPVTVEEVKP
jgi:hypothetical protein